MQAIRQRYWMNPTKNLGWRAINPYCIQEEVETAWRGINYYCVKENNENTGYVGYYNLEGYIVSTGEATGYIKPNNSEDPDYITPTYNTELCPLPQPPLPEPEITPDTPVLIYIDNSGSMGDVLPALTYMKDHVIKSKLLPFYNNDEVKYNEMVKVITDDSERTMKMLAYGNITTDYDKVITMVFQNETYDTYIKDSNWSFYTGLFDPDKPRQSVYDTDIQFLRNRSNSVTSNGYLLGTVFAITTGSGDTNDNLYFTGLLEAAELGQGNYAGQYGLSDKPEFKFKYKVKLPENIGDNAASAEYYGNLVVTSLQEHGFNIP